jgi:uncharacterized membrane protein YphA (DoxX/SURF4 family)
VPLRSALAYLTALMELGAGVALLWPRAARAGALTLTALYAVFTIIWLPTYLENPRNFDPLGNVFEEFSLVVAGAVLYARLSPEESAVARREPLLAQLYGFSAISFGVGHIFYYPGILGWIPKWLPPSQMFWEYATTIGFFMAAVAILTGVMAPLASRLVTVEILSFELLVWIPKLIAGPQQHINWAGNAISIALSGAPWVVADSIARRAKVATVRVAAGAKVRALMREDIAD